MEIVLDTNDLCWDFGTITRVSHEGQDDIIKVVRTNGYTYYIGTEDRDAWAIISGMTESDLPSDWTPTGYYYYPLNNEWVKNQQPITGDTESYLT